MNSQPLDNALGLGTAALGRPQYINIRQGASTFQNIETFKQQGVQVLEEAYRLGIRYFDTAPGYGLAEELLLDWLGTKNDDSIQVATKWGYTYVANFDSNALVHEVKEHSLSKLNEQWEFSKGFLPRLNVYQIHSATFGTGVLENSKVLGQLAMLKEKHDLEIGLTTTGDNQTEVIQKALEVSVDGKPLFDAFQVTYNILDQSLVGVYKELIDQDKRVIVKEALANGRLFRNPDYGHYAPLYGVLEELAELHQTGVDAIALKFCAQTLPKSILLSGASNLDHLRSNLNMNTFMLSEEDIHKLAQFKLEPGQYWQERKKLSWS